MRGPGSASGSAASRAALAIARRGKTRVADMRELTRKLPKNNFRFAGIAVNEH